MDARTKFARLVAAIAIVTVAPAAAPAVGAPPLAIGFEPCPLATTSDAHGRPGAVSEGGYLLGAALIAPPRPESGFDCPINRTPAAHTAEVAE